MISRKEKWYITSSSDIQSVDGICIHPLDPADITYEKVESIIPSSLTTFLNLLCSGPKRKMLAIAQDIISLNSGGKKRMPKNTGLGMSLKNSLRSKEYITLLNNLGHCISYDDVL